MPQSSAGPVPDLSIVILTWNSRRHIETCVRNTAARAAEAGLDAEFHIVDNGSTDGTPQLLRLLAAATPRIHLTLLGSNQGTTRPRNLALAEARGKYVCVLDSDAYPQPGCFEALHAVLRSQPRIGIVAPRLIYPDGRHQKSVDRFPTLPSKIQRFLLLKRLERTEPVPAAGPVDYAISAFWLLRRGLLRVLGPLDEQIFYSPEDVEYCLRAWQNGYPVWYDPNAVAVHDAQEKSRSLVPNRLTWSHLRGLIHLFAKYGYVVKAPAFRAPLAKP